MKTIKFESKEEWFVGRKGKITGSRASSITAKKGTGKKIGFYELIAEKLAVSEEDFDGYIPNETPMNRGTRLEPVAINRFELETGKKVDPSLVIWEMEDHPDIAISPDGIIDEVQAVETKCLSSARHLEAWFTKKIPDEYFEQAMQYFVVNELLETLYFVLYDPRIVAKDYFVLEIHRKDYEDDITFQRDHQIKTLEEIGEAVNSLTF